VNLNNKVDDRFDHGMTCFYMNTRWCNGSFLVGMENSHNLAIKKGLDKWFFEKKTQSPHTLNFLIKSLD